MQVNQHFPMKYMDFRFSVFDRFDGQISSEIDHGCGGRLNAKPRGRFGHMSRELSILESNAGAIDEIKRSRRSRDKNCTGRIFKFDKTTDPLVNTLPELCTYDRSRFTVYAIRKLSAYRFAYHCPFSAAEWWT